MSASTKKKLRKEEKAAHDKAERERGEGTYRVAALSQGSKG